MGEIDKIILENAYKIARAKGIETKSALAKKAGMDLQNLNSIQNGTRSMGKRIKSKLVKALEVSESELMRGSFQGKAETTGEMGENGGTEELKDLLIETQKQLIRAERRINELEHQLAEARGAVSPERGVAID